MLCSKGLQKSSQIGLLGHFVESAGFVWLSRIGRSGGKMAFFEIQIQLEGIRFYLD